MPIELCFPTPIYCDFLPDTGDLNKKLLEQITILKETVPSGGKNWVSDMYNTLSTYNLINDPVFDPLLSQLTTHVNNFATVMGVDPAKKQYKCTASWFNICKQGNYQDLHYHTKATFSGSYYVTAPEGSADIVFETPLPPNTHPMPIQNFNTINTEFAAYKAEAGKFIIFPSYLRHCVKQHKIPEDRISIAFNFD